MTFTHVGGDPEGISGLAALAILAFVFVLLPASVGLALRARDARLEGHTRRPPRVLPRRVAVAILVLAGALEVLFNWFAVAIALLAFVAFFGSPSLILGRNRHR